MVHSQAFAEDEWKNAQPWNPPTAQVLAPGKSIIYGLRFLVSDSIRNIENTLSANDRPVAIGIPGYVLPTDLDARLFLKYPKAVKSLTVEPRVPSRLSQQNRPLTSGKPTRFTGRTGAARA